MNEDKEFKYLLQGEFILMSPKISPDGQWLAYMSVESNLQNEEIYVSPFPDVKSGKWQITRDGGFFPLWSPDGQELYYMSPKTELIAVQVEADTTFHIGKRETILEEMNLGYTPDPYNTAFWDIHPDGKRILMIKPVEKKDIGSMLDDFKINIVLNWFEELKQRVPVN